MPRSPHLVLTFPQLRKLATWLETQAENHQLDGLTQKAIAEQATQTMGFEVRASRIRTLRDQLDLSWKRAVRSASKKQITLPLEDFLCITETLCAIVSAIPSMRLDPEHCMEELHQRLKEQDETAGKENLP